MAGRLVKSRAIYVGAITVPHHEPVRCPWRRRSSGGGGQPLILNILFAKPLSDPALAGGIVGAIAAKAGAGGTIGKPAPGPH
jgi:hypothetical protein